MCVEVTSSVAYGNEIAQSKSRYERAGSWHVDETTKILRIFDNEEQIASFCEGGWWKVELIDDAS